MADAIVKTDGTSYQWTAVTALASGDLVEVNGRMAVVQALDSASAAAGQLVAGDVEGIFDVAKQSAKVLLAGQEIYWDGVNEYATYYQPNLTYLGVCVADAAASATTVRVHLNAPKPDYAIDDRKGEWRTTAVDGLGTVLLPPATKQLAFDAVAEAAKAVWLSGGTIDVDDKPIMEARIAVYDVGDHAALDIDCGLASGDHATDFEAITAFAAIHLDGSALDILVHSDDGTTDVAAVDSTINAVDDTYVHVLIDARNKADVQIYVNGVDAVPAGTTLVLSAYTSTLSAILHMEKTSNDTTAEVRCDFLRVWGQRTAGK